MLPKRFFNYKKYAKLLDVSTGQHLTVFFLACLKLVFLFNLKLRSLGVIDLLRQHHWQQQLSKGKLEGV